MGKIRVGQKRPQTVNMGGFTVLSQKTSAVAGNKVEDNAKGKPEERANRLKEILEKPVEEQLSLLLAEGFDKEAKELSEKLAKEAEDDTTATETPDAPDAPDAAESAEKKEDNAKGKPSRKASAKKTK